MSDMDIKLLLERVKKLEDKVEFLTSQYRRIPDFSSEDFDEEFK